MRPTTRRWLLLAVLTLVLAACTVSPASPSAQAPTPAAAPAATVTQQAAPPTETATAAPSATPTAAPSPEAQPEGPSPAGLALASIPNPFERQQLAPGTAIDRAGLYFMDVTTGAIEAWSLRGDDGALTIYSTSPDNRWLIAYPREAAYAADRRTGSAYRWGRNTPYLLAALGDYLLFRDGTGQGFVAGPGQPEPIALPCGRAGPNAPLPVIAPDGQTAIVADGRTLYLVQLKNAACRAIGEVTGPPGGSFQSLYMQPARQGEAIVVNSYWQEGAGRTVRRITRYSWQGEQLGELTLPVANWSVALSPDGRLIAWEERLSDLAQTVVVADAATLAPRFRVTGASLCFSDLGWGDWLADSSALIVRTSAGYRIVTAGGELLASPALSIAGGEPLPAPDRADLIAVGRMAVIDPSGRRLAAASFAPGSKWDRTADISPWGLDSRELRFALPHGGHGGKCGETEYLLPARVEQPPFGPLTLAVGLPAGDCVNLRAEPGTQAQVLTCLPGGTRLSVAPLAATRQPDGQEPYYLTQCMAWAGNSRWLRVRAPDGQEGWVDDKAGQIGWALPTD